MIRFRFAIPLSLIGALGCSKAPPTPPDETPSIWKPSERITCNSATSGLIQEWPPHSGECLACMDTHTLYVGKCVDVQVFINQSGVTVP